VFVESRLRPHADEWEAASWFPNEVFGMLAERGWLGLKYGPDADWVADAVFAEELARCASGGLAAGIGAHTSIATPPIAKFGTPEQVERWLEPAIRGEKIGALAITEPDAGSDVASARTRAVRVDGGWLVNGAKTFITNGVRADFYVTAVRTRLEPGHGSLSFLVIERGEGVRASKLEKLGWHASDTGEIAFDDVFVPDEHLLGEEGRGFYLIMANFQWERLLMALGAVGSMRAGIERALPRVRGQAARHVVAWLRRAPRRAPRSPSTRCGASWPATPCARSRWPSSPRSARASSSTTRCSACSAPTRSSSGRRATRVWARSVAGQMRS
jgi:acyl-CoA dehydrogenase